MKKPVRPPVEEKIVEVVFIDVAIEEDEFRRPATIHEVTGKPVKMRESSANRWILRDKALLKADYDALHAPKTEKVKAQPAAAPAAAPAPEETANADADADDKSGAGNGAKPSTHSGKRR